MDAVRAWQWGNRARWDFLDAVLKHILIGLGLIVVLPSFLL